MQGLAKGAIENVHSTDKRIEKTLICDITGQNITRDALNATFHEQICMKIRSKVSLVHKKQGRGRQWGCRTIKVRPSLFGE